MNDIEKIEYYLGKDRLPNIHWKTEFPAMWAIPARSDTYIHKLKDKIAHQSIIDPVTGTVYKLNNLGYRSHYDFTDDLKNQNLILMLGCSDTWGRFVDYDQIYCKLIQDQLGTDYTVVNLSVPGGSPDQSTRIGVQAIKYLGSAVKQVCMFWPGFSLREFVSKTFSAGVYVTDRDNTPYKDWWDHIDWVSNNYNYQKNLALIEAVCEAHDVQYHDLIVNRENNVAPFDFTANGAETVFGPNSHQAMANYFLKKIKGQASLYQTMQS
jgi:hypothetical protein